MNTNHPQSSPDFVTQGDVNIIRRPIPNFAEPFAAGGILAFGEATGHCHQIEEKERVYFFKSKDRTFLRVLPGGKGKENEPVCLKHEEHKALHLTPGDYEYGITREFDYDEMESKKVVD